jgi:NAD(P)-dependent dehydrogenase (short-subunit alcohol dehydrogenase family)
MIKKHALVVGGSGALGRSVVNAYLKKTWFTRWKTLNIDFSQNSDAVENVILNPKESFDKHVSQSLHESKKMSEEFDAIIHVAGGYESGSIRDFDIFEKYERMFEKNVLSAFLTAHLASHLLAPCGVLSFTGAKEAFYESNTQNLPYALSKV